MKKAKYESNLQSEKMAERLAKQLEYGRMKSDARLPELRAYELSVTEAYNYVRI